MLRDFVGVKERNCEQGKENAYGVFGIDFRDLIHQLCLMGDVVHQRATKRRRHKPFNTPERKKVQQIPEQHARGKLLSQSVVYVRSVDDTPGECGRPNARSKRASCQRCALYTCISNTPAHVRVRSNLVGHGANQEWPPPVFSPSAPPQAPFPEKDENQGAPRTKLRGANVTFFVPRFCPHSHCQTRRPAVYRKWWAYTRKQGETQELTKTDQFAGPERARGRWAQNLTAGDKLATLPTFASALPNHDVNKVT